MGGARYETFVRKLITSNESQSSVFAFPENATKLANLDALSDFKLIGHLCDTVTSDENNSPAPSSKFYYIDIWERSKGFRE